MKKEEVDNRGGRRKGSGRKKIYQNPTSISFIIEKDLKDKVLEKYKSKDLKIIFIGWLESLIK